MKRTAWPSFRRDSESRFPFKCTCLSYVEWLLECWSNKVGLESFSVLSSTGSSFTNAGPSGKIDSHSISKRCIQRCVYVWIRYRRHYGSKVNRSKNRKQDVIAFVNTVTQFIHRGSYAHIVTVVRKFSWICWLGK